MMSFFNSITSGRFISDSSNLTRFADIYYTNPYLGRGFGSILYADFAYLEAMSIGGLFGLIIFITIYFYIIILALFKMLKFNKEGKLLLFIWTTVFFASLGAPAFTANRVSIIIWILTTLLLLNLGSKNFIFKMLSKKNE